MAVFVIFTNDWAITIIWKKKKGTLPVVQNNMITQDAEIPLAQQTLRVWNASLVLKDGNESLPSVV